MFKCEVTFVLKDRQNQETYVEYKVSTKGNSKTPNHSLVGSKYNERFFIGQVDNSIKKGDLLRCDGLPFTVRPVNKRNRIVKIGEKVSKGTIVTTPTGRKFKNIEDYVMEDCGFKFRILEEIIPGYKPFQLDSGYWVLRKSI